MRKTKETRENKGITLIALIITIIVLLILAGISIAMLTGNNGILAQAKLSKENTAKSEQEEKEKLYDLEDKINEQNSNIKVQKIIDENPGKLEESDTEIDTYYINSIEDLVFFAYDVSENGNTYAGKKVKLNTDLDFNSNKSYVEPYRTDYGKYGYDGELKTKLTTGEGFTSIGRPYAIEGTQNINYSFNGEFDGQSHTIYNIYINRKNEDKYTYQNYGLFSEVYNGKIINLNVHGNINFDAQKNNILIGMIAGLLNEPASIENCQSSGKIVAKGYNQEEYIAVGGIVGQTNFKAVVSKCGNEAEIDANHQRIYVGGIAGSVNANGTILKSYNVGAIHGEGENDILTRIGGIAGHLDGKVENCYNIGKISGKYNIGAIAGVLFNNKTSIIGSQYNNTDVSAVGRNTEGAIAEANFNSNLTLESIKELIRK